MSDEEQIYGYGEQDDSETPSEDLTQWEPPKLPPPEPHLTAPPPLARVRRGVVIGMLSAAGLGMFGFGAHALFSKPSEQNERMRMGKGGNERARLPEAIAALGKDKKQEPVHTSGYQPGDESVAAGWLNQKAKDPTAPHACDELEDPNAVVRCMEARERLEKQYPWGNKVPDQNMRGYSPGAYAANPQRDQEDESALEPPPLQVGGDRQGQQGGQAVQPPSQPSAVPSVGISPLQAHQMAEAMAGMQSDDPEDRKEKFMAQDGIRTLSGDTEDVGECDLSAGTPVHGSVLVATNSDLPANNTITIKVNKAVMCGADGEHVAIPQGSTFVGSLDQRITYGQDRIQLCMKQLQRPKSAAHPRGDRKQLGCFVVADIQGRTGMNADVDNHWGAVIGGSLLSAILSLGTTSIGGDQQGFAPTIAQNAARAAGNNLNQAGNRIVNRELQRKPTLTTEMLEDVVILFSSNLQLDPWTPAGKGPKLRRMAAW